jgi:hypothetical protein
MSNKLTLRILNAETSRNRRWFSKMCLNVVVECEGRLYETDINSDCGTSTYWNQELQVMFDNPESGLELALIDND